MMGHVGLKSRVAGRGEGKRGWGLDLKCLLLTVLVIYGIVISAPVNMHEKTRTVGCHEGRKLLLTYSIVELYDKYSKGKES